jgi:hypothetical protein
MAWEGSRNWAAIEVSVEMYRRETNAYRLGYRKVNAQGEPNTRSFEAYVMDIQVSVNRVAKGMPQASTRVRTRTQTSVFWFKVVYGE